MLLSAIFIVVVGAIAFFHYVQGFFSAFLSLVICLISAAVALGMHEQIITGPLGGKTGDYATALVLCGLYAVTYFVLRLIFDACIPGNVSFGVWPDRIGGAVMGGIAGMITAGILFLGASSMPFEPVMAMYSPVEAETTKVELSAVPYWAKYGRNSDITDDLYANDQLKEPQVDSSKVANLILPVDKFAQGYIALVSAGSLEGGTRWLDMHPNYSEELFYQRLGVQPGAKRTAYASKSREPVEVAEVFRALPAGFKQIDGDNKEFRVGAAPKERLEAGPGKTLLVVRVVFGSDAAEKDGHVRFSLGSFRLVAGKEAARKNYLAVATLREGSTAVFQHTDDFLIVDGGKGADLVFEVDTEAVLGSDAPDAKILAGTFLEYKRATRISLADREPKVGAIAPDERTSDSIYRRRDWPGRPKPE